MKARGDTFELLAFSTAGDPIPPRDLSSAMVVDLEGMPAFEHQAEAVPGKVTLPVPDEPFGLSMALPVDGFGHVYVRADSGGLGYQPDEAAGHSLNFCLEAARSRLAAVTAAEQRFQDEGTDPSADYAARIAAAQSLLAEAEKLAADPVACAGEAMRSLAESMQAGEMLVGEHARSIIATSSPRKGFLFGCATLAYERYGQPYAELFSQLLNFATVPFYRAGVERDEGSLDFGRADRVLEWALADGLEVKGHPLVFFDRSGVSKWMAGRSFEEAKALHRRYILEAVGRYKDRVPIWDVINEAHDWANEVHYTQDQLTEMTRLAAESTREADPKATTIVNSCCTWSEYVARGRNQGGPIGRPARTVLQYVRDAMSAGIDFDVIGLQIYYPEQDMFEIDRQLDRFCALGKPVHVTELGVSSSPDPMKYYEEMRKPCPRYWHGRPWSEAEQADWIEAFYTLCYAKPGVEAVTWWDFTEPSFIPHAGLTTEALRPKESYHRLKRLIEAWSGRA
jgi:endo-1,4-beta-xylanase